MIEVREEYCPQNHRCPTLRVCPTGALTQEGYGVPKVNADECTCCQACVMTCPVFVGDDCDK